MFYYINLISSPSSWLSNIHCICNSFSFASTVVSSLGYNTPFQFCPGRLAGAKAAQAPWQEVEGAGKLISPAERPLTYVGYMAWWQM